MKPISSPKEIRSLLDKIRDHVSNWTEGKGVPSLLDIDVVKGDIRMLYRLLDDLPVNEVAAEKAEERKIREMDEREIAPDEAPADESGKKKTVLQKKEEEEKEKEKEKEKKPPQRTEPDLPDLFSTQTGSHTDQSETKTVADKIGNEKKEKSIGEQIGHDKLSDLKKAIGINDKFFFINELFEGDLNEYNKAIDKFNEIATEEEILDFFESQVKTRSWNRDSEACIKLKDIIGRKTGMKI